MKHVLKKLATGLLALGLGFSAHAKIKPYQGGKTHENADYKEMYVSSGGNRIADDKAFTAAIKGEEVYHCVIQEASMNKTGKGAALRNVKKKIQ